MNHPARARKSSKKGWSVLAKLHHRLMREHAVIVAHNMVTSGEAPLGTESEIARLISSGLPPSP